MDRPAPKALEALALLRQVGPLTALQMSQALKTHHKTIYWAIRTLRKRQLVYIHSWKRSYGTRGRWAARYAPGTKPDATPPVSDRRADATRHYRKRVRARMGHKPRGQSTPFSV